MKRRQRGFSPKLSVETLEDRRLLAVISVDNLNDSGVGSLRAAIAEANGNKNPDVVDRISFSSALANGTINLATALPAIIEPLSVEAFPFSSSSRITLNGSGVSGNGLTFAIPGNQSVSLINVQGFNIEGFSGDGIRVTDLPPGTTMLIRDHIIDGNGGDGVHAAFNPPSGADQFEGLSITDNVIINNDVGIRIDDLDESITIRSNRIGTDGDSTADGNRSHGIYITNSTPQTSEISAIEFNTISGNTEDGIRFEQSTFSTFQPLSGIRNNEIGLNEDETSVIANGGNGIVLSGSRAVLSFNDIGGNAGDGVLYLDADSSDDFLRADSNYIGTSSLSFGSDFGNGGAGIRVTESITNGVLDSNFIFFNDGAGIALTGAFVEDIEITENTYQGNGGLPIDINDNGPTENDPNDLDNTFDGPNNVLNYPILDTLNASLTGGIWSVPVEFDAFQDTEYRFEFYRYSASADRHTFIKSEIFDTAPEPGSGNITTVVSFTDGSEVNAGDLLAVSAVQLGASGRGDTSELSPTTTALVSGPPVEVSAPDLTALSDSGAIQTDNITNDATPTFSGTATAGATVDILVGVSIVGTGVADSVGNWSVTTSTLNDGVQSISARATNAAGSTTSAPLQVTIDTAAPQVAFPNLLGSADLGTSNTDNITSDNTPTFASTGPVTGDGAGQVQILADGVPVSPSVATNGLQWVITTSALTDGVRSITARVEDTAGNVATSAPLQVTIDTRAAQITDVLLSGSSWNGLAPYSYAQLVANGDQLTPLFTQSIDTVEIQFNEGVAPFAGETSLKLVGSNGAEFTTDAGGFSYDDLTDRGTWTFAQPLPSDKYRIELTSAGIEDIAGLELDGEWTNLAGPDATVTTWDDYTDDAAQVLESGDGTAGGDFVFFFSLLAGDTTQNGLVDANDLNTLGDVNGDGSADAADVAAIDAILDAINTTVAPSLDPDLRLTASRFGGDYVDNEVVDINDYLLWRSTFQNGGGDTRADANDDGAVNVADYVVWRDNIGLSSAWYAGSPPAPGSLFAPLNLVDEAPQVVDVVVSGSMSTDDPFSFSGVVGSGEQLRSIPVSGADTISVVFSEEVFVKESDLVLTNLDGTSPSSPVSFFYDVTSQTATWTFGAAFDDGRTLLTLSDSVHDLDGVRVDGDLLDGDFVNPWSLSETATSAFPSGNGQAGEAFRFRFTVLAGDADRDNIDGATDYTEWLPIEPGMIRVSTLADEDDGDLGFDDISLREALAFAATQPDPQTLVFGQTLFGSGPAEILLGDADGDGMIGGGETPSELAITSDVSIVGPGADQLTISGGSATRVVRADAGNTVSISGLTIADGRSTGRGGGIYNESELTLNFVTVRDNEAGVDAASRKWGGGVYSYNAGLTVYNSTIADNEGDHGGGIAFHSGDTPRLVRIDGSTIARNYARSARGGGVYIFDAMASPSTATFINSTLSGNTAGIGGSLATNGTPNVNIYGSTITANHASFVGGGHNNDSSTAGANITLHFSIVAGNTDTTLFGDDDLEGPINAASSYNLIGRQVGTGLVDGVNGNIVIGGDDPGLMALGDYGGPTQTHALMDGSLAIGAGDLAFAELLGLDTDQRGQSRGGAVDLGAFQLAADEYFGTLA